VADRLVGSRRDRIVPLAVPRSRRIHSRFFPYQILLSTGFMSRCLLEWQLLRQRLFKVGHGGLPSQFRTDKRAVDGKRNKMVRDPFLARFVPSDYLLVVREVRLLHVLAVPPRFFQFGVRPWTGGKAARTGGRWIPPLASDLLFSLPV